MGKLVKLVKKSQLSTTDKMVELFAAEHQYNLKEVRTVFDRFLESGWEEYEIDWLLWDAAKHIAPSRLLKILEGEDPKTLHRHYKTFGLLRSRGTPFYTLEELSDVTQAFINYFKDNKRHLIRTGYPLSPFNTCLFFDFTLNKLYPVKLPVVDPTWFMLFGEPGPISFSFDKWAVEPAVPNPTFPSGIRVEKIGYSWRDGKAFTSVGQPVTVCEYEEAGLLPGLKKDAEKTLNKMREKLYGLRIRALERLIKSLEQRDGENLLGDWFQDLSETLHHKEIGFLHEMDRFYERLHYDESATFGISPQKGIHHNSGLSGQATIICHAMKELSVGAFQKTREVLKTIPITSYIESFGKPERKKLDAILDGYEELEAEEEQLLESFGQKVRDAFLNRFFVAPADSEIRIPLKDLVDYKRRMKEWADLEARSVRMTGSLSRLPLDFEHHRDGGQKALQGPSYIFQKEGDIRWVAFDNSPVPMKHTLGLNYIAYLLSNPHEEFNPKNLWQAVQGADSRHPDAILYKKMKAGGSSDPENGFDDKAETTGLSEVIEFEDGEAITPKTRKNLTERLETLSAERTKAEEEGDSYEITRINSETEVIRRYLDRATDIMGRTRKLGSETEKRRKSITKAINRCMEKLKDLNTNLWAHLDKSLHTGNYFSYSPDQSINWKL